MAPKHVPTNPKSPQASEDLRGAGLRVEDIAGLSFDPLSGRWRPSRDLGVNYIAMAARG